jgi:hypothetical protein
MLGMKTTLNNGELGPFWEGEGGTDTTPDMDMDMSLDIDMFTEEGEGDVDDEVRCNLAFIYPA